MKKFISMFMICILMLSFAACSPADNSPNAGSIISSNTQVGAQNGEYPSAQSSITDTSSGSAESGNLSSLASAIASANSAFQQSGNSSSSHSSSSNASSSSGSSGSNSTGTSSGSSSHSSGSSGSSSTGTSSAGGIKGVWYSYLEFSDTKNASESAFTSTVTGRLNNIKSKGYNSIFIQVRPFGDAMYQSSYYPWSYYASGSAGKNPGYDPFAIVVRVAKRLGLQVHAWINPYRVMSDAQFSAVSNTYKTKQWYNSSKRSDYMVLVSGYWWLKPGNSEVVTLIENGARELINNYNIDGIHIDDYFYGTSISTYGDSSAEAKSNTTKMVKALYNIAHSKGKVFGVSPAGGFRSSIPDSDNKYLSTNLNLWCKQSGYIDYVAPQIYWSCNYYLDYAQFETVLSKWNNFVTSPSVKLYVGLAPYKADMNVAEINRQIALIKKYNKSTGYIMFRYAHIAGNEYTM